MFGLNELKQIRVYQEGRSEGKLEGKLEAVPYMVMLGATVEQIAEALNLDVEQVRRAATNI